jgi:hypothetical protein
MRREKHEAKMDRSRAELHSDGIGEIADSRLGIGLSG